MQSNFKFILYFNMGFMGLILLVLISGCASPHPPIPAPPPASTFRVALLAPVSGELAPVGQTVRNGIILAFDQRNAQGGILGRQVVWEIYDSDCTFNSARQAAQQAIQAGHQFIIGPICSEAAIGAAPIVDEAGLFMISPAATHPGATTNSQGQTWPTVFTVSYTYTLQGQAAAQFARQTLNFEQAAIIYQPTDLYAGTLAGTFAGSFETEGGQIVYQATYNSANPTELTEILQAADQAGATLIYAPGDAALATQISRQLNELDLTLETGANNPITLLGSDAWQSEELDFVAATGSYFPVHFLGEIDNPVVQNWIETYKSNYALQPDTLAALGFEAANVLAQAVGQANTFDPEEVAKVLEQYTFESLIGPVTFNSDHTPVKPIPFVRVQENGLVHIATIEP